MTSLKEVSLPLPSRAGPCEQYHIAPRVKAMKCCAQLKHPLLSGAIRGDGALKASNPNGSFRYLEWSLAVQDGSAADPRARAREKLKLSVINASLRHLRIALMRLAANY